MDQCQIKFYSNSKNCQVKSRLSQIILSSSAYTGTHNTSCQAAALLFFHYRLPLHMPHAHSALPGSSSIIPSASSSGNSASDIFSLEREPDKFGFTPRSSKLREGPVPIKTPLSIKFLSSRTFPFHWYSLKNCFTSSEMLVNVLSCLSLNSDRKAAQ